MPMFRTMPRVATDYRYVFCTNGQFYAQAHGWKSRMLPTARAAASVLAKKLAIACDALRKVSYPQSSFFCVLLRDLCHVCCFSTEHICNTESSCVIYSICVVQDARTVVNKKTNIAGVY